MLHPLLHRETKTHPECLKTFLRESLMDNCCASSVCSKPPRHDEDPPIPPNLEWIIVPGFRSAHFVFQRVMKLVILRQNIDETRVRGMFPCCLSFDFESRKPDPHRKAGLPVSGHHRLPLLPFSLQFLAFHLRLDFPDDISIILRTRKDLLLSWLPPRQLAEDLRVYVQNPTLLLLVLLLEKTTNNHPLHYSRVCLSGSFYDLPAAVASSPWRKSTCGLLLALSANCDSDFFRMFSPLLGSWCFFFRPLFPFASFTPLEGLVG